MEKIAFVQNFNDLSTDEGFQFEFVCDRCGNGYRTKFEARSGGKVTGALNVASNLLGGVFGSAADVNEQVQSSSYQKQHDEAYERAMNEILPDFVQCPKCVRWVCKKQCWNDKKNMCLDDVEEASAS